MQYYNVPGAAEDDICGPGIKTRLARSRADPPNFVMILCLPVLAQIDGQPKMFADIRGNDLSHNTWPTPMTDDSTLYMLAWYGMSIDQLRERVLSVYIGRTILLITSAKYAEELDAETGKV